MADVRARPRGSGRDADSEDADRGQLFIVGALTLAVLLVTLALLLNTAIYTGNLATRDPGPGTTTVVEYENAADAMGVETIGVVNYANNSSYSNLTGAFTGTVDAWSAGANTHAAMSGADPHVETVATVHGARIGQTNSSRNFTSDSGDANWTVANESRVRNFTMQVNTGLLEGVFGDAFHLNVTNSTGATWTIAVRDSLGPKVEVEAPDGTTTTCDGGSDPVAVDLTNESVDGAHCAGLEFLDPEVVYNVSVENGGQASGTYSLVVDRPPGKLDTGADDAPGGPFVTHALYSADLRVTYRSTTVAYRTQVRIAPGEPDE